MCPSTGRNVPDDPSRKHRSRVAAEGLADTVTAATMLAKSRAVRGGRLLWNCAAARERGGGATKRSNPHLVSSTVADAARRSHIVVELEMVLWFRTSRPGVSGHAGLMCRVMADRLRSGMLRHVFYSVGIGRTHTRTRVIALIQDLDITIINVTTGEVLRPTRPRPHQALPRHRTTTRPHPHNKKRLNPRFVGSAVLDVPRHHSGAGDGTRTHNLLFTRQLRCQLRHSSMHRSRIGP